MEAVTALAPHQRARALLFLEFFLSDPAAREVKNEIFARYHELKRRGDARAYQYARLWHILDAGHDE